MENQSLILTFYSYKGGLGRSMALANVANTLCHDFGLKVLMVDWDLEAPGLESFFFRRVEEVYDHLGLVDLLTDYSRRDVRQFTDDQSLHAPLSHRLLYERLKFSRFVKPIEANGRLALLPAGRRAGGSFAEYAECVQQLDFRELYHSRRGREFFAWLRQCLLEWADVTLIDSRTGITDMGGVCTRELPDAVVTFVGAAGQSVAGVATMAQSFLRGGLLRERSGRPLEVLCVPTRVEEQASGAQARPQPMLGNDFQLRFGDALDRFAPPFLAARRTTQWNARIPYDKDYAGWDGLVPSGSALCNAYRRLVAHVALMVPEGSTLAHATRGLVREQFSDPVPYLALVALDAAGAMKADEVVRKYSLAGALPAVDLTREDARLDAELPDPGSGVRLIVLSGTRGVFGSRRAERAIAWAEANGWTIRAIDATPNDVAPAAFADKEVERWFAQANIDLAQNADFLRTVPNLRRRTPYQVPPSAGELYVRRPKLEEELLERLQPAVQGAPAGGAAEPVPGPVVVVHGPAGAGKTQLVTAVCRDWPRMRKSYPDGVLWVKATELADVAAARRLLCAALLPGDARQPQSADPAFWDWYWTDRVLGRRQCLIVVDDVDFAHQVQPLLVGGPCCTRIVLSRNSAVALALRASGSVAVGVMEDIEAHDLLRAPNLAYPFECHKALAKWPLALAMANARLRAHSAPADDAEKLLRLDLGSRGLAAMAGLTDALEANLAGTGQSRSSLIGLALDLQSAELRRPSASADDRYAIYRRPLESSVSDISDRLGIEEGDAEELAECALERGWAWADTYAPGLSAGRRELRFAPLFVEFLAGQASEGERAAGDAERAFQSLEGDERALADHLFLRLVAIEDLADSKADRGDGVDLSGDDRVVLSIAERLASAGVLTRGTSESEFVCAHADLPRTWLRWRTWIGKCRHELWYCSLVRQSMREAGATGVDCAWGEFVEVTPEFAAKADVYLTVVERQYVERANRERDFLRWQRRVQEAMESTAADAWLGGHLDQPHAKAWAVPGRLTKEQQEFVERGLAERAFRQWRDQLLEAMQGSEAGDGVEIDFRFLDRAHMWRERLQAEPDASAMALLERATALQPIFAWKARVREASKSNGQGRSVELSAADLELTAMYRQNYASYLDAGLLAFMDGQRARSLVREARQMFEAERTFRRGAYLEEGLRLLVAEGAAALPADDAAFIQEANQYFTWADELNSVRASPDAAATMVGPLLDEPNRERWCAQLEPPLRELVDLGMKERDFQAALASLREAICSTKADPRGLVAEISFPSPLASQEGRLTPEEKAHLQQARDLVPLFDFLRELDSVRGGGNAKATPSKQLLQAARLHLRTHADYFSDTQRAFVDRAVAARRRPWMLAIALAVLALVASLKVIL